MESNVCPGWPLAFICSGKGALPGAAAVFGAEGECVFGSRAVREIRTRVV